MALLESLPNPIRLHLQAHPEVGEVRYALASDLTLARAFGETWVAVTSSHLLVLDTAGLQTHLPLHEIKSVKVDELFGSARLIAEMKRDGDDDENSRNAEDEDADSKDDDDKKKPNPPREERRLLYYTRDHVPAFSLFARVANDMIKEKPVALPETTDFHAACKRCGAPLRDRGAPCSLCVPRWEILKRLIELLVPHKAKFALLVAITFLMVTSQLGPPYITKIIIDDFLKLEIYEGLGPWVLLLVGFGTFHFVGRIISGRVSTWLAARLVADLQRKMHAHVQRLEMAYFNKRDSGELVGRIMGDTQMLQHFLIDGMPYFLVNSIMFVGIGAILLHLDVMLTGVVLLPVPFLILGGKWFRRKIHPLMHRWGTLRERMHTHLQESISGIKPIKAFAQQESRDSRFGATTDDAFRTIYNIESTFINFSGGMFWIMGLGVAMVWYFGAERLAESESFTLGSLMAFVGYIWLFYGPLQWFSAVMNWSTRALAGAERIFAVLDAKPEIYDPPDAVSLPSIQGDITFQDVRFSYERGKEVIKGVSFEIARGEMIGLVGKSGVGKSTLINLVCRFYDVDDGAILVDGHDLRSLKLGEYRRQIGIVMQEPFLFHASIIDNLRLGLPDASFDDVVRAAKAAHAHEFILAKEDGYDTIIGEKGAGLSGGEKQRISIARAILHNPPILILDEATSSVDVETEKKIQDAITELVRNRTTIAIAHRLSTLRNANRLVVMDEGKLAEIGSHEDLLAQGGIYAKLVKTQSEVNELRSQQQIWEG